MPKHISAILITLLLAPLFAGCNEKVAKAPGDDSPTSAEAATHQSQAPQVDVATQPNTLPENDATAKQVCQRFLGLLAQNERSLAGQLLTRQALKVTVDAGLELEAMGSDGSSVEVGDAVYATSRAKVAQVPCTVTEKNGQKQSLLWMMRRSESGWRIAGLIVNSGKSQELLSLENRADVAAIMGAQGGSAKSATVAESNTGSQQAKIRQVSATDDE